MKTKLILTATLFTILIGGFASVGDQSELSYNCNNEVKPTLIAGTSEILMKGIIYEGEVIPFVELPELVVNGKRNSDSLTKAKLINGEIVSVVDLEEVTIFAQ
jgi:hypothetical protein